MPFPSVLAGSQTQTALFKIRTLLPITFPWTLTFLLCGPLSIEYYGCWLQQYLRYYQRKNKMECKHVVIMGASVKENIVSITSFYMLNRILSLMNRYKKSNINNVCISLNEHYNAKLKIHKLTLNSKQQHKNLAFFYNHSIIQWIYKNTTHWNISSRISWHFSFKRIFLKFSNGFKLT